jgi:hypothetical protein
MSILPSRCDPTRIAIQFTGWVSIFIRDLGYIKFPITINRLD